MPAGLPQLTAIEEVLIARVHVSINVYQYRGAQYHYQGHVAMFMSDNRKIYRCLPLLPDEVDVIRLVPASTTSTSQLNRLAAQHSKSFLVRRAAVQAWLEWLVKNHPGYADVEINHARLRSLPEQGQVDDRLAQGTYQPDQQQQPSERTTTEEGEGEDTERSAIPDIADGMGGYLSLDGWREELQRASRAQGGAAGSKSSVQLAFPETESLDVYRQKILTLAFPTLFPWGMADFAEPRLVPVDLGEYAQHLLQYHDGRFARHSRFRYVVFNMIQRRKALTLARAITQFIQKQGWTDRVELDMKGVAEWFSGDSSAAHHTRRQFYKRVSTNLRGTEPYWRIQRRDLQAMVRQLGPPHLFVTFTAADLWWADLVDLLDRGGALMDAADERDRKREVRRLVTENPVLVNWWFDRRFKEFLQNVLIPKFNVKDWSFRKEYQQRGSVHVHGLLWCEGAPDPTRLVAADPLGRDEFAKHWDVHLTALDPDPAYAFDETAPGSRSPLAAPVRGDAQVLYNTMHHLAGVLGADGTRHECQVVPGRCGHVDGEGNLRRRCTVGTPLPLNDSASVARGHSSGRMEFVPRRNNPQMRTYNRLCTMSWLAGQDIQPVTSNFAVVAYITKYITKDKLQRTTLKTMLDTVLASVPDDASRTTITQSRLVVSFFAKLCNRLVGSRIWSASEVTQNLLKLPYMETSRTFIPVYMVDPSREEAEISTAQRNYMNRPRSEDELTFFQWLKRVSLAGTKSQTRRTTTATASARENVLVWLTTARQDNPEDVGRIAFAKVHLHHPFRTFEDLLRLDGLSFSNHVEAFEHCKQAHVGSHPEDHLGLGKLTVELQEDRQGDGEGEDVQMQGQSDDEDDEDDDDDDLINLCNFVPQPDGINVDLIDLLGQRPIDRDADWSSSIGTYPECDEEWMEKTKLNNPTARQMMSDEAGILERQDTLTPAQADFYNLVAEHYRQSLDPETSPSPPQLLLHLDGPGGTGKSTVVGLLRDRLELMHQHHELDGQAMVCCAPTGVAAFTISGSTIHTLLAIPVNLPSIYSPLAPKVLEEIRQNLQGVRYLLIDEKSMVGLPLFYWIDRRCKDVWSDSMDDGQDPLPFGGRSVILCGDFYQLPPVNELSLFATRTVQDQEQHLADAQSLYRRFTRSVQLDVVVRQGGDDPESHAFRQALDHMRRATMDVEDWKLLSRRVRCQLSPSDQNKFANAMRLYGTREAVAEYNHTRLRDSGKPVILCESLDFPAHGKSIPSTQAGNLEHRLGLSIGTTVMLTDNLWVERGLVNGTVGMVREFV